VQIRIARQDSAACDEKNSGQKAISVLYKQCVGEYGASGIRAAQRNQMGHRTMFRGDEDGVGIGSLRSQEISGLESSYTYVHACSFFSAASPDPFGKKKLRLLLCHSSGYC